MFPSPAATCMLQNTTSANGGRRIDCPGNMMNRLFC